MPSVPPTEKYERALRDMETAKALSEKDRQLLRALYGGTNHSLTTREIAAAMKWTKYNAVNAHFGKLAQRLAERMQWEVPDGLPQITAVATFQGGGPNSHNTRWTMRPELVSALEARGIVMRARPTPPTA